MNARKSAVLVSGLAVVVGLLAGCTGDDDPAPDATGSSQAASPTPSATADALPEVSAGDVASELFETTGTAAAAVGKTSGPVPVEGAKTRVVDAEVYAVDAYEDRTLVSFGFRSGDGKELTLAAFSLAGPSWNLDYVDGFAVVDPEAEQRLESYREAGKEAGDAAYQTCSLKPKTLGPDFFPQTCVLPPLDPRTTTVTVEIPDLPAIDDVPVTRPGQGE